MISYVRNFLKNTKAHQKYWSERKIDWNEAYLSTWNHPHRYMLAAVLKTFQWQSLMEIGCGGGANLANFVQTHPGKQLGGSDVSADAIAACQKAFQGAFFKHCPADNVMMSDNSCDVVLSDMLLIYINPREIDKVVGEMKRIARQRLVLCEFHSESWWERFKLKLTTGYNMYDYVKLLQRNGLHDVTRYKIPKEAWPGGVQEKHGYIIVAKVPRRK